MISVLDLISSSGYITVNKAVVKEFGLEVAVMLGELASKYNLWAQNDKLENGWFYLTRDVITEDTGLSEYSQRQAEEKLMSLNILDKKKLGGFNRANYYYINTAAIVKFLNVPSLKNDTFEGEKFNDASLKNDTFEGEKFNDASLKNDTFDGQNLMPSIVKKCDDIKKEIKKENKKEIKKEATAEADNLKSRAYKNLINYINSLMFNDNSIKEELISWYETHGKGKVSVEQLQSKLKDIANQTNNNEALIKEAIKYSNYKGYMAFYPKQNNFKSNTEIHCNRSYTAPTEIRLADECF